MEKLLKTIKIPISEIQKGMKIKSVKNNKIIFNKVIDVWNTEILREEQCRLEFTNGTIINCSTNHPIMVLENEKIIKKLPNELTEFDQVITENNLTYIFDIKINQINDTKYIDITVEKTNTFFVADKLESEMILTHNSQGGIRGASATLFFPLFHLEVEDLIVLKNNKGTDETRIRHMDYSVQINGYLYGRLLRNEKITLFSPHDVPDLYEAFFNDQKLFGELYEKYERAYSIRKKSVSALELFTNVLIERNNTGRIYIQNVDHCNTHGSFNEDTSPVYQNNLCVEITLPTAGLTRKSRIEFEKEKHIKQFENISAKDFRDEYGEIALCTLSSINWGMIQDPSEFEKPCDLAVRALNELLDYQDYPMLASGIPSLKRKSLGVGISNLAYVLAKNDMKYSDGSANDLVNEYTEAMSYYLIKASMEVAKEKGACGWFSETKYSKGIFPIHTYKKEIDNVISKSHYLNWDSLINDVKTYGMANSTVMAIAPVESSSQIANATNGIEPPRGAVSMKSSKDGTLKQVIPEIHGLKNKYEYLWDMPHTRGYLELAGIIQKWTDQSISTNTTYNPANYTDNKVPMSELIKDLIYAYKLGCKSLYYQNTSDGSGEVFEEDDCESCKL